jgi:RNA exonuclease 4
MAPELSSNWKKLQASLKTETKNKDLKRKAAPTERQLNTIAKRKRLEAKQGISTVVPARGLPQKRRKMGIMGSTIEDPDTKAPSASLTLWAEDHEISAKDLAEAYGSVKEALLKGVEIDRINAGCSKDVEVGQYVAIDCEMVGVGGEEDRSVLARVSIVNYHGEQIYDSFVRPKEFVTDWRTHVSGVSTKNMATARTFEQVQADVTEILEGRILIGHAIKNDLDAMMMGHPKKNIRDTSRFSGFRKYASGRTPSLKKLAKEILGVEIQGGEHSSIEDARATMLLFRRHKQAFDAEHTKRFPHRPTGEEKSKSKKKNKSKR